MERRKREYPDRPQIRISSTFVSRDVTVSITGGSGRIRDHPTDVELGVVDRHSPQHSLAPTPSLSSSRPLSSRPPFHPHPPPISSPHQKSSACAYLVNINADRADQTSVSVLAPVSGSSPLPREAAPGGSREAVRAAEDLRRDARWGSSEAVSREVRMAAATTARGIWTGQGRRSLSSR